MKNLNGKYNGCSYWQLRGIYPSLVENTIQTGRRSIGKEIDTFAYYDPVNNINVIANSQNGQVVTTNFGWIRQ